MGCVPHLLPGYQGLDDVEARRTAEESWGGLVPIESGLDLRGIFDSVKQGEIKAMFIVGDSANFTSGELSGADQPETDLLAVLENLDLLVVQDHFLGPAAQKAHVVLPRSTFAEKEGTYTNLERRVQALRPVLRVKNSEAQPESWAICQIAQRMNAGGFDFASPAQVMDEIAELVPMYGGVSHRRA